MIITTNSLNNIETKITTPQIEGIEFINAIFDENEIKITSINASYNDIMTIIGNGKLPIIRVRKIQNNTLGYSFIQSIGVDNNESYYISTNKTGTFVSDNAIDNLSRGK